MTTSHDPKELMSEHAAALRAYANRVLAQDDSLAPWEQADRVRRVKEYLAIGSSFKLTEREMVSNIYRGILSRKSGCGCPTCRTRVAR